MLDCASNYSIKYGGKICIVCKETDDENHRINWCKKWESTNLYNCQTKAEFRDIYSSDVKKSVKIVGFIASLRDLESGKNKMRTRQSLNTLVCDM